MTKLLTTVAGWLDCQSVFKNIGQYGKPYSLSLSNSDSSLWRMDSGANPSPGLLYFVTGPEEMSLIGNTLWGA